MPYNGVGVFQRVYQWVQDAANGIFVDATRTDTDSNDIAAGLTNCVTRDGQSPWLANIPAGGFKITGLAAGANPGDSVNYGQVFTSPTFNGLTATGLVNLTGATSVTVPTVAFPDNSNNAASTAFVMQAAFNTVLPAQPGGTARYDLTSLGGTAAWLLADAMDTRAITGASTVTIADAGNLIDITSGTFTLGFDPVATLGDKTAGYIRNSGTGEVTFDPSGAETIDGLASYVMYPGEIRRWFVDGSVLKTLLLKGFYMVKTVSGNFVAPPGYSSVDLDLVGGSGGGGSGRRGAAGTARSGGAPGGTPARVLRRINGLTAGSTIAYLVGAAGVGGAAVTVDDTNGTAGTAGGNTSFGSFVTAFRGVGGIGGTADSLIPSSSGSGSIAAGTSSTGGAAGGAPATTALGAVSAPDNYAEGGGATTTGGGSGGNTIYGGAGSGHPTDITGTTTTSASSIYGVPAGGHGGYIRATNVVQNGGTAGLRGAYTAGGGAAGGTSGAAPTAGAPGVSAANDSEVGSSVGGGGSTITGGQNGMPGGDGGFPGGAGGGGGAVLNGQNSGAGGNGSGGRIIFSGVV